MIHGDRVSDGCLPVGDAAVEELFVLVARVGLADAGVIISPVDLRRIDPGVARARASGRPPWLGELYSSIAVALKAFPLPPDGAPIRASARPVKVRPKCRPYDRADCEARCRRGDLASCSHAGLMYEDGRGVTADTAHAWALLEKACAGGDAFGCAELSRLYLTDDGHRRDATRAAELARAACDAGEGQGCSYLADLCVDGITYPRSPDQCSADETMRLYERAMRVLEKDCRGWGAYDCSRLATLYADDDLEAAFRFAMGSCQAGDPGGCSDLGRLYEDDGNVSRAYALYARACRAGYAEACERSAKRKRAG
jgi:TPR repeat protein